MIVSFSLIWSSAFRHFHESFLQRWIYHRWTYRSLLQCLVGNFDFQISLFLYPFLCNFLVDFLSYRSIAGVLEGQLLSFKSSGSEIPQGYVLSSTLLLLLSILFNLPLYTFTINTDMSTILLFFHLKIYPTSNNSRYQRNELKQLTTHLSRISNWGRGICFKFLQIPVLPFEHLTNYSTQLKHL